MINYYKRKLLSYNSLNSHSKDNKNHQKNINSNFKKKKKAIKEKTHYLLCFQQKNQCRYQINKKY